jgi:hypothetical protein
MDKMMTLSGQNDDVTTITKTVKNGSKTRKNTQKVFSGAFHLLSTLENCVFRSSSA